MCGSMRMQRKGRGIADESCPCHLQSGGLSGSVAALSAQPQRRHGRPLETATRGFFESRLGHDFGDVRIHDDGSAAAAASAMQARAYTVDTDIVFSSGQYAPDSDVGQQLLAHELTHTVQQARGLVPGGQALDGGAADPLEQAADRVADGVFDTQPVPTVPTAVPGYGLDANLQKTWPVGRALTIQRAPALTPHRAPDPDFDPGHTSGDDYQGPHGASHGDSAMGGLVSYGCYCGPGGDPDTGSRCSDKNAPAVDEIDEQCRQHDGNYFGAGVDSSSIPGRANMWSLEGLLKSNAADRQLHASIENELDMNGDQYSSTTKLYGQGIKGIFGARAATSGAYNWLDARGNEASAGVGGAIDSAESFIGDRADEASSGVSQFIDDASKWSSFGDAATGIAGGVGDATSWLANTALDTIDGVGGAIADAESWLGTTALEGVLDLGGAVRDGTEWQGETLEAIGGVLGDQAAGAANWVGNKATGAASSAAAWLGDAEGEAMDWLGDVAGSIDPRMIGGPLIGAPGLVPSLAVPLGAGTAPESDAARPTGGMLEDLLSMFD